MQERRSATRADYRVEARLVYAGESFASEVLNLSLTGTLINTAASPWKGQHVTVTFLLDDGTSPTEVCCEGQIVRADHRGLGIEFGSMNLATLGQLQRVLAAYSGQPERVAAECDDLPQRQPHAPQP